MPSVAIRLHSHSHRIDVDHVTLITCGICTWCVGWLVRVANCTSPLHQICCIVLRKSRIVSVVELIHRAADEYCERRLAEIQKAKERHAYDLKCKAVLSLCVAVRPCICMHDIRMHVCIHTCHVD